MNIYFKDIFLKIDYFTNNFTPDLNHIFFKRLKKRIDKHYENQNRNFKITWVNTGFMENWTIEWLRDTLKREFNKKEIKEFLKAYPEWLEYFI